MSVGQESGTASLGPGLRDTRLQPRSFLQCRDPFQLTQLVAEVRSCGCRPEAPASLWEVSQGLLQLPGAPTVPSSWSSPGHSQDTPSLLSEKTWCHLIRSGSPRASI